jgi:radical SAM superfamily enzyme YgiQ (UPF0313 family)
MKIGFLALSGVRAHDARLLELGLTLPGVIERSRVVGSLPSLGLLSLAACTPPGHELRYWEAHPGGIEPPEAYTCDVVAISTLSAQAFEAYAAADRLRKAGVRVVLGGLHASVCPEEALAHAHYVVVGEGERVWPELVRSLESGRTLPRWDSADFGIVDVNELPTPRYDLLQGRDYNRFTVQTTRGCPWRCDFCASSVMLNHSYRKRATSHIVRDIAAIQRLVRHPFIEFADDNTFVDKEWGKELCRQLAPLRFSWFTETDISVADDVELLTLMRRARCRQVLIGLESPELSALEGMELRANWKAKRGPDYFSSLHRIQEHGITVNGCFILGLDRHTPDIFEAVLDFVESVPLYEVQITILTPFPGTPLYQRLEREGRLLHPGGWDRCTLFDVTYEPRNMSPEQLREGVYWLTERLYDPARVEQRRRRYFNRFSTKVRAKGKA